MPQNRRKAARPYRESCKRSPARRDGLPVSWERSAAEAGHSGTLLAQEPLQHAVQHAGDDDDAGDTEENLFIASEPSIPAHIPSHCFSSFARPSIAYASGSIAWATPSPAC